MCLPFDSRQYASAFDQPLNFDTSKVTTMYQMFNNARAFNQPLSFDTSSVTDMSSMFYVRSACALGPQPSVGPSPRSCRSRRRRPTPAHAAPHPASYALLSTRQYANSLSNANKLLIRCAWAGTSAFASAGYGSSWGPGSCT